MDNSMSTYIDIYTHDILPAWSVVVDNWHERYYGDVCVYCQFIMRDIWKCYEEMVHSPELPTDGSKRMYNVNRYMVDLNILDYRFVQSLNPDNLSPIDAQKCLMNTYNAFMSLGKAILWCDVHDISKEQAENATITELMNMLQDDTETAKAVI